MNCFFQQLRSNCLSLKRGTIENSKYPKSIMAPKHLQNNLQLLVGLASKSWPKIIQQMTLTLRNMFDTHRHPWTRLERHFLLAWGTATILNRGDHIPLHPERGSRSCGRLLRMIVQSSRAHSIIELQPANSTTGSHHRVCNRIDLKDHRWWLNRQHPAPACFLSRICCPMFGAAVPVQGPELASAM
jgi:hypothetical protein